MNEFLSELDIQNMIIQNTVTRLVALDDLIKRPHVRQMYRWAGSILLVSIKIKLRDAHYSSNSSVY